MKKNNFKFSLGIFLLIIISTAVFVFAVSYDQAPSNAGNATTITMLSFNVSNSSNQGNMVNNITIDLTGATASYGNLTNVTISNGTTTWYNDSFYSATFNVSIVSNITAQANFTINFTLSPSATDNLNLNLSVTDIWNETNVTYYGLPYASGITTIDSLEPYVEYETTTTASSNLSQSHIYINISANDTVSNMDTIIIYIHNSSAQVNSSTNSSVGATSATQTINWTGLSDGIYYINATVNDSYNHINNSLATRTITLDTTAPSVSASCSPSTAHTGDTITCSCSGTDATSGVNSSLTSASSTPSTSATGTFSYGCGVTDNAGNTASTTVTYIIEQSLGGVSTTTTSPWLNTHTLTDTLFEKGYSKELGDKSRIKFKVNNEYHHVGVKSVTADTATIEIASDPMEILLGIGEDAKVDVSADNFYDVYVLLNGIVNNKANVTILKIHEEVPEEQQEEGVDTSGTILGGDDEEPELEKSYKWLWVLIILVIIAAIIFYSVKKK